MTTSFSCHFSWGNWTFGLAVIPGLVPYAASTYLYEARACLYSLFIGPLILHLWRYTPDPVDPPRFIRG